MADVLPTGTSSQFRRDTVVQMIAVQLDMPSLYMGGPSNGSRRKADQIVAVLETNGVLSFEETP